MEELYLILGCFGNSDDGFVNCRSCENRILQISPKLINYNSIMDFFDSYKLYDKPIFDINSVRHCLKSMQDQFDQFDKRLWHEKKYKNFEKFICNHRDCGLYLKLEMDLKENISEKSVVDEKIIPIVAHEIQPFQKTPPILRGRR